MRKYFLSILLVFLLSTSVVVWLAGADEGKKTIADRLGVTVVKGSEIVGVYGQPIDKLRLFAIDADGRAQAIPFQVDQRDQAGYFVLPNVFAGGDRSHLKHPAARRDNDGFAVDGNDELVFRTNDAGHRAAAAETFHQAAKVLEIELSDNKKRKAWVYLAAFEGNPPPLSNKDYVRFDPQADMITTALYAGRHRPGRNDMFLSSLRLAAGDGAEVLDRTKIRMHLKSKVAVSIDISEDDIEGSLDGYIDGPVRIIRRSEHDATIGGLFKTHMEVDAVDTYEELSQLARLRMPLSISTVASEAWIRGGFDMTSAANGMKFYASQRTPFTINGQMEAAEKNLSVRNPTWLAWSGHGATMVLIGQVPANIHAPCSVFYVDDAQADTGPDDEPGSWGQGMYSYDLMGVKRGVFQLDFHLFIFKGNYRNGVEWQARMAISAPLKATVRELPG
ncbi:MAG: hypothetical protein ACTSXZ_08330 [Alphaproteobacteria bacterium]